MSIPIVIVWGHRDSMSRLGWTAAKCHRCQIEQPFAVYRRTRAHHIYFLTVSKEKLGLLLVCDFCDSAFGFKEDEAPPIDTQWTKSQGLEALAQSTDPDLLPLSTKQRPTDWELLALLESTNEKGKVLEKDITVPFFIGGIASGVIVGALLILLRRIELITSLDEFGFFMLGLLGGGFVGGVIWSIRTMRERARMVMSEALQRAVTRHRIDKKVLREAFVRHAPLLGRLRRVFESGF